MAVADQVIGENYALYLGDSVEVMRSFPDKRVDLTLYSPPFCGLYNYSSSERDLSNCRSYSEFFEHYGFVVDEIERITKPGRLVGVHCMDIPRNGANLGGGRTDFPGDIIGLHTHCRDKRCKAPELERRQGQCGHGLFDYVARYDVWKEPLGVRNRTMSKALAHQQIVEDATLCDNASADYLLMFRKKGESEVPVKHPTGLTRYAGERIIPHELQQYRGWTGKQTENRFSHWIWRQYASAFWDDVRLGRVLPHKESRDPEDERHVHPLQLDVIERAVVLWSNPGDVVFTPFMGVGSEVYGALINGRKALGVELKQSYFRQAVQNCQDAKPEGEEMDMFKHV